MKKIFLVLLLLFSVSRATEPLPMELLDTWDSAIV